MMLEQMQTDHTYHTVIVNNGVRCVYDRGDVFLVYIPLSAQELVTLNLTNDRSTGMIYAWRITVQKDTER